MRGRAGVRQVRRVVGLVLAGLLVAGTPEQVAAMDGSHTGEYLARRLPRVGKQREIA